MEEERKNLLFVFVFSTYLPICLLKFQSGELVGCEIWFCIERVPTLHTFDGPCYPKNKKYLNKCDDDIIMMFFSGIYYFCYSEVCQRYAVWVLVVCRIKFCIQWALPIEIWVKTKEYVSQIRTKNVVFLRYISPNLY